MVSGSLAAVVDAKPYAREAARRAIADHAKRRGMRGTVTACPENNESHRFIHALLQPSPLVSIIIPTRDRMGLLKRCVESIRTVTDYQPFEIMVVDNGSIERDTLQFLRQAEADNTLRVVPETGPFNYSRLNNRAAAKARGDILVFLNNDTEVDEPGWLTEMVSHAARAEVGAVGARLWYPDETLQHGGVILGLGGVAGHAFPHIPRGHPGYFNRAMLQQNCSAVTGACMAVRKSVFEELGGFDEENLAVSFNDRNSSAPSITCRRPGAPNCCAIRFTIPISRLIRRDSRSHFRRGLIGRYSVLFRFSCDEHRVVPFVALVVVLLQVVPLRFGDENF